MSSLKSQHRVCPNCRDLEPDDDGCVESPFKAVEAAAKKGCESCSLLCHAIKDCLPEAAVHNTRIIVRRSVLREFVEIAVHFAQSERTVVIDLFTVQSKNTSAEKSSPWRSIRIGIETSGNTVSLTSFRLAEQWLSKCVQHHISCSANMSTALPSRVLDLWSSGIDLSLSHPHNKEQRYACLSHCWGESKTITTTIGNLEAHKKTIAFTHLPRTFQEAVIFTRKLGIQYLWIDSLCIIQDDEEDWQKESAKMAHIYQNSYVTIAATGSGGPREGLFSKYSKTRVSGVSRDGTEYEVHARQAILHMDEAKFPLLKRGWVYQERLLAPRVLHFGRQELWWECLEMVECECSGILEGGDRYATGQEKFSSKLAHQAALSNSELPHVSRRWHAIVEEFSQLGLTKARDKLPALSGIAQQMSHMRNGTYLAGLWSDTLITDLLWYRIDPSTAKGTAKWRCPTFSWASHDGPVRYFDAPHDLETSYLGTPERPTQALLAVYITAKATVRPLSSNQFGEISSAHLFVHGLLVPILIFDERSLSEPSTTTQAPSRRIPRRRRKGKARSNFVFRFDEDVAPFKYSFFADSDLHSADATFAKARYALLRVAKDSYGDEYALILKCIEPVQGICERVGLFTTKFTRWRSPEQADLYSSVFTRAGEPRELVLI